MPAVEVGNVALPALWKSPVTVTKTARGRFPAVSPVAERNSRYMMMTKMMKSACRCVFCAEYCTIIIVRCPALEGIPEQTLQFLSYGISKLSCVHSGRGRAVWVGYRSAAAVFVVLLYRSARVVGGTGSPWADGAVVDRSQVAKAPRLDACHTACAATPVFAAPAPDRVCRHVWTCAVYWRACLVVTALVDQRVARSQGVADGRCIYLLTCGASCCCCSVWDHHLR